MAFPAHNLVFVVTGTFILVAVALLLAGTGLYVANREPVRG